MKEIIIALLDKFLWVGFVFSLLGIIRVIYLFILNLRKTPPQQLLLSNKEVIALGAYIAIVIMSIFTGIRL